MQQIQTDQVSDKLLYSGSRTASAPYNLIFEPGLNALDIRVWLALRAFADNKIAIHLPDLCDLFADSTEGINDSLAMLDIYGWVVIPFNNSQLNALQPIVCVKRIDVNEIIKYNSKYKESLLRYIDNGSERVQKAAFYQLEKIEAL